MARRSRARFTSTSTTATRCTWRRLWRICAVNQEAQSARCVMGAAIFRLPKRWGPRALLGNHWNSKRQTGLLIGKKD